MKMIKSLFILMISLSVLGALQPVNSIAISSSTEKNQSKQIKVYWNVPTYLCHRYGLNFEEVSKTFGMIQNPNDTFEGEEIVMLYDVGEFPSILKIQNGSTIRNGGVPQKGDLLQHLDDFKLKLTKLVDRDFSGVGIIDFADYWRPVFRQNREQLNHVRNYSFTIERENYPYLDENVTERLASEKFEIFARLFMEETIKSAKKIGPKASWGYYSFPYCLNFNLKGQNDGQCSQQVVEDNDKIQWLWNQTDVLLPSIYFSINFTYNQKIGFINGRLNEARRIVNEHDLQKKIFPYFWYKYYDSKNTFVKRDDLVLVLREIKNQNVDGFVLWGSSDDLNSEDKCHELHDYLINTFGPLVINAFLNDVGKELSKKSIQ